MLAKAKERLAEELARGRLEQELIAELLTETRDGGFGGTEDLQLAGRRVEQVREFAGLEESVFGVRRADDDVGERGEGGIAEVAAELDFLFVEERVVLRGGEADGVVIGIDGLDDDLAGGLSPAGASGGLGEELEGAFGGAEIGDAEAEVGVDDAD